MVRHTERVRYVFNDGGRGEAGYKGFTGDCVCRAIAIAAELPYKEVYEALAHGNQTQRKSRKASKSSGKKTAARGIDTSRKWFKDYMESLGFTWVSTMGIGTGTKVHLQDGELPNGRLIARVTRHYVAVIDGVLNDTGDCSRGGTRAVYGYWQYDKKKAYPGPQGARLLLESLIDGGPRGGP